MKRNTAAALGAVALTIALLPALAAPAAGSGSATLNATVGLRTEVTLVSSDTIAIRSNGQWTANVQTAEGDFTVSGGKTGTSARVITLESDVISYELVSGR